MHHTDRKKDKLKPGLSEEDIEFLRHAMNIGLEGIVLDNHPVALETANFLSSKSNVSILPMIPYAQEVVDKASSSGLSGVVKEMASSIGPLAKTGWRSIIGISKLSTTQIGAHLATCKYLNDYPRSNLGKVCFLHNVVTDLMIGWESERGIECFARAIRMNGMVPGFVTLNPNVIPEIAKISGSDSWFMTSVNSAGIQMGPDYGEVEENILSKGEYNILAMSLLGGGILDPQEEIPRALSFPAVKSVVVGTTSKQNLDNLVEIISSIGS